ncbi:hypothetical protein JCM18899A_43340 [Nocardioides sp. AN3]
MLAPLWSRVRDRLERAGLQPNGRVVVETPTRDLRRAAGDLLGRGVTAERVSIDLSALDSRLRERAGVTGLVEVLTVLDGTAPVSRPEQRALRMQARQAPLDVAATLVSGPWVATWVADLQRTGLLTGRADSDRVVRDAAAVLTELLDGHALRGSRVELAARVLGDAHGLDADRAVHQVVVRGLAAAGGLPLPGGAREREDLWAAYGVDPDLLSRTALLWRIVGCGASAAVQRLNLAAEAGDPVHVTEWDLRRIGELTSGDHRVLVCENPRVLEAVAEEGLPGWSAVCIAGEPNLVVDKVLQLLVESGAPLRYHGDFDWPGIAIANRVIARFGAQPLAYGVTEYLAAVRPDGPPLVGRESEADWDRALASALRDKGRAVHEESTLPELLDSLARLRT